MREDKNKIYKRNKITDKKKRRGVVGERERENKELLVSAEGGHEKFRRERKS